MYCVWLVAGRNIPTEKSDFFLASSSDLQHTTYAAVTTETRYHALVSSKGVLVICYLFSAFFFSLASAFAAGPLLHIWTAERYCDTHCIPADESIAIMIGTEFPDIRYITELSRQSTHPYIADIDGVGECSSAFDRGMRLHAWLDVIREDYIPTQIYERVRLYCPEHSSTFLKFLEEEILFDLYDASRWSFCFGTPLKEELQFTSSENITKWHEIIRWTLALRPSTLLWIQSYRGPAFGVPAKLLYSWSYLLQELRTSAEFREYCMSLLEHIDQQLTQSNILGPALAYPKINNLDYIDLR